jgi:beta-aspartyl-dipeptidase (metallo-type)
MIAGSGAGISVTASTEPFFKLLRGGRVLAPRDLGEQDVLIAGKIIARIAPRIDPMPALGEVAVLDVQGKYVVPGFIDQHVHLIGGGGEGGFTTRSPELMLGEIVIAGITTVVGCLGTDGTTRSVASLLAKARALEEEGITAYIYTGAYEVPPPTITGRVRDDLILIDKVLGCGEVAIGDHRSSQPSKEDIRKLAAESRVGGMLGGKAGVLHLHVGNGSGALQMLLEIVGETEIPISQFTPTHLNRSMAVLNDGLRFAGAGGMIDITTSIHAKTDGREVVEPAEAVRHCLDKGVSLERITLSSDGNGSIPNFDARGRLQGLRVADIGSLHETLRAVVAGGTPLPDALRLVTENPAASLRLSPAKGCLAAGSDADVVVLDRDLAVERVFARGRLMVAEGKAIARSTFEEPRRRDRRT